MKLLFDENLSHKLARLLEDLFPNSIHVRDVGLKAANDSLVWQYALNNDLILVSKDADMHQRSFLFGPPPGYAWGIARRQMWKDSCGGTFPPSTISSMTLTRHFWFYPSVW
jgi:hypothetical protein